MRELFGGRLQSAAVEETAAAPTDAEVDEDALANDAASTSEAKPAQPALTRIKITWSSGASVKLDPRNREKGAQSGAQAGETAL